MNTNRSSLRDPRPLSTSASTTVRRAVSAISAWLVCLLFATAASAATYFWDADGAGAGTGGSGTWDATSALWHTGALNGTLVAWPNAGGDNAVFTNTAGTVTLNASSTDILVNGILFSNTSGAYLLAPPSSGTATLNFSGTAATISQTTIAATIGAVISGTTPILRTTTTGALTLTNANTFSGGLTNNTTTGNLILVNANALGTGPFTLRQNAGGTAIGLRLTNGINVANSVNIDTAPGRANLDSVGGNNTLSGPITILGTTSSAITFQNNDAANSGTTFAISNTISTTANYPNSLSMRPNAVGVFVRVAGTVLLPNTATFNLNGQGVLSILSTGNTWGNLNLNGGVGTLRCGVANCLYSGARVSWAANNTNTLDLAGFDQTVLGLDGALASTNNLITNSSSASDATLTLNPGANSYFFNGIIADGARKLNLVLQSGTQTLSNANTFGGTTTISGGTLALAPAGAINNSARLSLAAGGTFDVSLVSAYNLGATTALTASGLDTNVGVTAATLKGGTSVNLGARPISLNYTPQNSSGDLLSPALYISQGTLTLNGQISVTNLAAPLDVGTYTLIQTASGTVSGSPTLNPVIGGNGLAPGTIASLAVGGGAVKLVVSLTGQAATATIVRHTGTGASSTYGDALQFDVTVSPNAASGTVTVRDGGVGGVDLGSGTLPTGSPNTVTVTVTALNSLTAGVHTNIIAVYAGDPTYSGTNSAPLSAQTVGPKNLTVSGAVGGNKPYNGTTAATYNGTLNGVVSGDTASDIVLVGTGTFANASPGTHIAITPSGTLGGPKAADYTLTQPTGLFGDIVNSAIWNTTTSGENWSTAGDWVDNAVGDGAGATVDFSTLDLLGDVLVHLDSPRSMQTLIFGDTDTNSPASWLVDNDGLAVNTLTLAGTAPSIAVNGMGAGGTVTIGPVVAGSLGLTKSGNGTLILATNNTYTGGTTISAGTLQIGADTNLSSGTLGSGSVLDNGTLMFKRLGNLTLTNNISGTGSFVHGNPSSLALTGTNTYSGGTTVASYGALIITNTRSLGSGPVNLQSLQGGANATFLIGGAINVTNALNLDSTTGREMISATNGNCSLSGPIQITGSAGPTYVIQNFDVANAGTTLSVSNSLTAPNFTGTLSLRGNPGNFGRILGTVNAPSMQMQINGNANWTIFSTGNAWSLFSFSSGAANNNGTLVCGADACLPPGARVNWASTSSNSLDVAGFNQTIAGLDCSSTTSTPTVTNSSATSDAVLTISNTGAYTFAGTINDGATHGIGLTVAGGSQTLKGANTYSGSTSVSNGSLVVAATGSIDNSRSISIGVGGVLDVSAFSDFTFNSTAFAASGLDESFGTTAAAIAGSSTVSLASQPVALNYTPTTFTGDGTHPALYVSSGALTLNGQITVNNLAGSPMGSGVYTLIADASSSVSGNPTLNPAIGGSGLLPNSSMELQLTGDGRVNLLVVAVMGGGTPTTTTIARHAGTGSSTTYGDALTFDVTVSASNDGDLVAVKDGGASGTTLAFGTLAGGTCTVSLPLNALLAGSHNNIVAVYGGDATYASSVSTPLSTQTVAQKSLTLPDAAALNKPYDGTTHATITGTLTTLVSGDTASDVHLVGTGTFASAGPGTAIAVTSTATLGGSKAASYALIQPTGLQADIVSAAIWNTTASGENWSTLGDWVDNAIGDGAGVTVDFNSVNIATDPTLVHLDSPRTMQTLIFGDTDTSTAAGWLVDNNGTPGNTLTLAGTAPGITVNALAAGRAATVGPVVAGVSGLVKAGSGTLVLTNNNTYSGGTTISQGTLQIGGGTASGSLGGGSVTNNGVLVVARADNAVVANDIQGTGSVSQSGTGGLTLGGANTYAGGTTVGSTGFLVITNARSLGTGPLNLKSAQAGPNTTFEFGGGINVTNPIYIDSSTGRELIMATNGNNTLSGSLVITGATSSVLVVQNSDATSAGTTLVLSGPISAPSFSSSLSLRGSLGNFGEIANTINAPNLQMNMNGNANWLISSTGNSWTNFSFSAAANNSGTLVCGAVNCLVTGAKVSWAAGSSNSLDLAGFNQTVGGLDCPTTTDNPTVSNSSSANDAVLTVNAGANTFTFAGVIKDGATHKLALTVAGGTNTLSGANSYSGDTTVTSGKLIIQQPTIASNSTVTVAGGAVLQLGFAVTNQVAALVLNGAAKAPGVYSSLTDPAYLAGAGSLLVQPTVASYPTNITFSVSGGTLNLTWPGTHAGWYAQSNALDVANPGDWFDVPNSQNGTSLNVPLSVAKTNVFYRLRKP